MMQKLLLVLLLFVFICANVAVVATPVTRTDCCAEFQADSQAEYCAPCLYLAKLYNGIQYNLPEVSVTFASLAFLFAITVRFAEQHFSNPVKLKTRMNN